MEYVEISAANWAKDVPFPAPVEVIQNRRTEKPDNWGNITNKFKRGGFTTSYTTFEALHRIGNGATWLSSILTTKNNAGFVSAKYLAIDVEMDGIRRTEPPNLACEMSKAIENGLPPLFYYHTFTHTDEFPRFRIVWELDEAITDIDEYRDAMLYLIELFNSDPATKDVSRFWAGGTALKVASEHTIISRSSLRESSVRKTPTPLYNNKDFSGNKTARSTNREAPQKERAKIRSVDFDLLSSRCMLWHLTVDLRGDDAHWAFYQDIQHLALSAHSLEGGAKRLREAIRENPQFYNNEKHTIKYYLDAISGFRKLEHEERCSAFTCPFYHECQHDGFISDLVSKKGVFHYAYNPPPRITVEEAERRLAEMIDGAIQTPIRGIHLINAPVGIGKTEQLIYMDFRGKRTLIAVPTHLLIQELRVRWAISNYKVIFQEEIHYEKDDIDKMRRFQLAGLHCPVKPLNASINDRLYTNDYDIAITTQDYFLAHFGELSKYYEQFILDEDVVNRFFRTEVVKSADLERAIAYMDFNGIIGNPSEARAWLGEVKASAQNTILASFPKMEVSAQLMVERMGANLPPFNIWALMSNPSTITKGGIPGKGGNGSIAYTIRKDVPKCKMIVLSATANDDIYRLLFKDALASYQAMPLVEMKGNIIFDLEQSFSASDLGGKGIAETLDALEQRNSDFFETDFTVITFRKHMSAVQKLGYTVVDDMYFHNTEGKDSLNGKNLLVFGKPRLPGNAVISMLLSTGYTPTSTKMNKQRLRRNGYEFDFYGFEDETLNKLLLWKIDSETIQCLGRARPLRNECQILVAGMCVEM